MTGRVWSRLTADSAADVWERIGFVLGSEPVPILRYLLPPSRALLIGFCLYPTLGTGAIVLIHGLVNG